MWCYVCKNWMGELLVVVTCKDKKQADELLQSEGKRLSEKLGVNVLYNNTIDVDYEFGAEVENMLPQEVARLKETPNHLGGCNVVTYEEYMRF